MSVRVRTISVSTKNGSAAVLCTVTKPREWEEDLLLMSVLPDLRLAMTEYGYRTSPTTENGVWSTPPVARTMIKLYH